ncbi:MAG: VCBS repeat-containing protein, partial [Bacteroidia bacterium]|nr:VCBS repeat-containing protein [Bacteroidia bacterium]
MNFFKFLVFFQLFFLTSKSQTPSTCFNSISLNSSFTFTSAGYDVADVLCYEDFNSDGFKDIICPGKVCSSCNWLVILLGSATGTFSPPTNVPIINDGSSMASGDFNSDGKMDLVSLSAGMTGNNVRIYLGIGNGTFGTYSAFSSSIDLNVIVDDLNLDGKLDLIFAGNYYGNPNQISVRFGIGNGSFGTPQNYPTNNNSGVVQGLVSGDFNNDGMPDIALSNSNSIVSVFLNTNAGILSSVANYTVGFNPTNLAIADFNSDGKIDVAISNYGSSTYSTGFGILFGTGAGLFNNFTNYTDVLINTSNLTRIIVGDYNGDSKEDIVGLYSSGYTTNFGDRSYFSVFLGNGLGAFNFKRKYEGIAGYTPTDAFKADFNNDGKMDISILGSSLSANNSTLFQLYGLGDGNFVSSYDLNYQNTRTQISISEDINNDGSVDIICLSDSTVSPYISFLSVHINKEDGSFDAPLTYTAPYSSSATILVNDFNGDHKKDIAIYDNPNYIFTFLNNGSNSFVLQPTFNIINCLNNTFAPSPDFTSTCDFNEDGFGDILTKSSVNANSNGHTIFLGGLNGNYTTSCFSTTNVLVSSTTADFNLDGHQDILSYSQNNMFTAYLGDGQLGFSNTVQTPSTFSTSLNNIKSSDFNNDGIPDICFYTNSASTSFATMLGVGNGSFTAGSSFSLQTNSPSYTINDFDIDGKMDVAFTNVNTKKITIILGLGTGAFIQDLNSYSLTKLYSANDFPINSSDYNNDGRADLSIVNAGLFSVLFNGISNVIITSLSNSICSGDNLVLNVNGASTYTWNTGSTLSSVIVSPTITSTYVVNAPSIIAGCSNTTGKIINVNPTPTLTTIASTNSVCQGTSLSISAFGANTYTWNTGANTNSTTVTPTANTVYTVAGTNSNNCSSTQTVSIAVDNTCQDVWPGDANSDGIADNLDILELGLHYTQSGPPRASTSNAWQSYFSNNWTGTITNGKNLNHSDCNGDGTINDDDTLAIYNNYGLTHAFKSAQTTTVNPQLSIVHDQATVVKGSWGSASIYLGDAITSINNINGLAFTINFDNTLIETNSIYVEYQNSFLDAGQNLHFRKLDFSNGKIFTATTHTINNNVSGNGLIAKLHYQ